MECLLEQFAVNQVLTSQGHTILQQSDISTCCVIIKSGAPPNTMCPLQTCVRLNYQWRLNVLLFKHKP